MIRINLLPVRAAKKKETLQQQLIIAGLALGVVLLAIIYLEVSISNKISGIDKKITTINKEIEKLKKEEKYSEEIKKKKKIVESKLKIIEDLDKKKSGPVHLMDELSMSIPFEPGAKLPKKIQINSLKEKGGTLELRGFALDNEVIAGFMTNLENSPYFKNITLGSTKGVEKDKIKVKDFVITCQLEFPEDSSETEETQLRK
ncbi:MAG: PilN domain-containing protein [Deltaproteobacteria bacterium]|nr:MAG: PilN domain-containing protein [Deltaproteobacteria bacterium]